MLPGVRCPVLSPECFQQRTGEAEHTQHSFCWAAAVLHLGLVLLRAIHHRVPLAFGRTAISAQDCCASAVQMQILLGYILCKQVRICSGDMSHLRRYHGYSVSRSNSIRYARYTQLVTTLCAGTCRTECCPFCSFRLFFPCPGQNQSQRALEMSPWPQSLHATAAKIPLVQASRQAF